MFMNVHECVINGVTVLEVEGRIDSVTAPAFEAQLGAALSTAQRLVVDLRQLLYISSAGFRVLYRAGTEAKQKNGKLVLCNLSATVTELFAIAGFNRLFTITATREEGVTAVAG
jgi:anti-sigma B factor antagonist